jgi:transcriptional regulator NrdR family protein
MYKLGKLYLVPCPRCGSADVSARGRVALEGIWPDVILKRRYRCNNCGLFYHTFELSEEEPTLLSSWPLPCERE